MGKYKKLQNYLNELSKEEIIVKYITNQAYYDTLETGISEEDHLELRKIINEYYDNRE